MIEKLEHELGQLIIERIEARTRGRLDDVRDLDLKADLKRTELAQANAAVNQLVQQLWPGARLKA